MTSPPRPQCQPAAKPGVGVSPPRHVLGGEGPLRTRSDQQSRVNDEALCGPGVTSSGLRGLAEAPRGPARTARGREWGRGLGLNPKRGRGRETRPGGLGTVAQPSWGPVRAAHPSNGVGRRCRPPAGRRPGAEEGRARSGVIEREGRFRPGDWGAPGPAVPREARTQPRGPVCVLRGDSLLRHGRRAGAGAPAQSRLRPFPLTPAGRPTSQPRFPPP